MLHNIRTQREERASDNRRAAQNDNRDPSG